MEELIFFAVIIFLSILESIARSRKAKRQREEGGAPDEGEQFEWAQKAPWEAEPPRHEEPRYEPATYEEPTTSRELPSYDDDRSYDDRIVREEAVTQEDARASLERDAEQTAADIWAEISGLAAGRAPQRTTRAPLPGYAPARPTPGVRRPPVRRPRETRLSVPEPRPPEVEEHRIHLAHMGYGTDPSERAPSEQDLLGREEWHNPDAAWARAHLRGSASSLRRAVILQEVLGPPASMRDTTGAPRDE